MAKKQRYKLIDGGKGDQKRKGIHGKKKAGYKGKGIALGILFVLLCVLAGILVYIQKKYHVENVLVEGNVHYTKEEIADMVIVEELDRNSLYLSMKYKDRQITDIPFIQTMSVEVVSPDTIRIMVYEKSVAGYVEHLGRFMYFDRDGIVVESSETRTMSVPQVTGIAFDHFVLYEPLPVEDKTIFQDILNITQILSKYEILTDKIYFNDANEITLYFDSVRVRLGEDNLEEKIIRLQYILPKLEGLSGILGLENYDDENENISFQQD